MINIVPILKIHKESLHHALPADGKKSMIDHYLKRAKRFTLYVRYLKAACVITDEGNGTYEIKNIATYPHYQRKGYGTQLIKFLLEHYKDRYQTMLVGTGDSTYTIPFYERCGFTYSHRIPDFFIKNYDHPMYEDGKQLRDMVYLKISKNG